MITSLNGLGQQLAFAMQIDPTYLGAIERG